MSDFCSHCGHMVPMGHKQCSNCDEPKPTPHLCGECTYCRGETAKLIEQFKKLNDAPNVLLTRYRDIARRAVEAYKRKDFMKLGAVAEELIKLCDEDK